MSFRPAWLAAVVLAAAAAWPQAPGERPAHPDHTIVEVPEGAPVPSASIMLEADPIDGFNLFLDTANFTFAPESVNLESAANEGHAHLYLNGKKTARLYSAWRHLPGSLFRRGINRLEVVLNAHDHSTWGLGGEPIGDEVLVYAQTTQGSPIVYGDVAYRASWRWGAARPLDGGGWRTVNDRGYAIRVRAGKLTTRNLELVPCHTPPAEQPLARFFRALSPPAAHAGHGSLLPNASRISRSFEEDLANPAEREIEVRRVRDPDYCQGHLLIARPTGSTPSAPSLEVSGSWSRGDSGPTPFAVRGAAAYGQLKYLLDSAGESPERQSIVGGVRVEVRRELDTMFDGVDFETMSETEQARRIARAIVGKAKLQAASPPAASE